MPACSPALSESQTIQQITYRRYTALQVPDLSDLYLSYVASELELAAN